MITWGVQNEWLIIVWNKWVAIEKNKLNAAINRDHRWIE